MIRNKENCEDEGGVWDKTKEVCRIENIERTVINPPTETKSYQAQVRKNPGVAALVSFIWPGAGQIYNGQILRGLLVIIVLIALAISVIGLIIFPFVWVWQIYDAHSTAKKINSQMY